MVLERTLPLIGSLRDQVVLVTGASSGIGRETALTFARQGAAVVLAARRRTQLEAVAAAVIAEGGRAMVVPTDVTDLKAARVCVNKVRRKFGRLDILINNAGILLLAPIEELAAADFEAMLRVNVFGALFMMQAVLPLMREQERGTIINVASLAGRRGVTPLGGYCATKFALVALTEALRTELDPSKIHVGLVMPGVVDTPMAQQIDQDAAIPAWPSMLNMPPDWVVAAILLATRFHLREISVPPGAGTMEKLAALAPALTDTLIRWTQAAGNYWAGRSPAVGKKKPASKGGEHGTRRGK
jgi:NAD(P)-dependent dehydrogenase (short-subunit alcohol dehydrogenase family)